MRTSTGLIGECWRSGSASLQFLLGAPLANARVALTARTKEEARAIVARHFSRFLDRCGVRVSVDGAFPEPGKGCVLCYNETSFVDVAAFSVTMWPHVDRAAAADLYAYVPGARAACRKAAIELVPRGNRAGTDHLLDRMVAAVRQGERVAWGGEGRLSGIDGGSRFKGGARLIAIRAPALRSPLTPRLLPDGE